MVQSTKTTRYGEAASPTPFDESERRRLREELGKRMKALRKARGLTLENAAQRTGLALSTIHKIENGRVSPSYENLIRIARGYGVGMEEVFAAPAGPEAHTTRLAVTRQGEGKKIGSRLYEYNILCNALADKRIIPMVARVERRAPFTPADYDSHEGEETVFVLSGRVELHVEHYEPMVLEAGDCAYFDSTLKHAMRALTDEDTQVFWACTHVDMKH